MLQNREPHSSDVEIDEAMIERLIHGFYGRVRQDEVLGPIFAARSRTRRGRSTWSGWWRFGPRS